MSGSAIRVLKMSMAGLVVAALVGVTSADATHVVKIASHISIRSHGLKFTGKVRSPNAGCLPRRKVTLYRTNGNVLGSARTNSYGHWKVTVSGSAGHHPGSLLRQGQADRQGAAGNDLRL